MTKDDVWKGVSRMSTFKKKINIIAVLSKKKKSEAYIVNFEGGTTFFKLVKYRGNERLELYTCLKKIDSPYLPKIIDIWEQDGRVWVLEEYVCGKSLREIIDKENISGAKVKSFLLMLCEALKVLHNNEPRIVHRDVKPENIIVTREGGVKLIDFDIARIYKEYSEHDTSQLGTRDYASPEQFGYMQTDERSDIFSAGIVLKELYAACKNKRPYRRHVQKIIKKATRFDPENRYLRIDIMEKDIKELYLGKVGRFALLLAAAFMFTLVTGIVAAWMSGIFNL